MAPDSVSSLVAPNQESHSVTDSVRHEISGLQQEQDFIYTEEKWELVRQTRRERTGRRRASNKVSQQSLFSFDLILSCVTQETRRWGTARVLSYNGPLCLGCSGSHGPILPHTPLHQHTCSGATETAGPRPRHISGSQLNSSGNAQKEDARVHHSKQHRSVKNKRRGWCEQNKQAGGGDEDSAYRWDSCGRSGAVEDTGGNTNLSCLLCDSL